jgi:hypothetical protein
MFSVVALLGIFGVAMLFAYVKFPPAFANKKIVNVFNAMTLGVTAILCLLWFLKVHNDVGVTNGDKVWLPLACIETLGVEIVLLGIFFLLRNFFIFKPPRAGGRGFFR